MGFLRTRSAAALSLGFGLFACAAGCGSSSDSNDANHGGATSSSGGATSTASGGVTSSTSGGTTSSAGSSAGGATSMAGAGPSGGSVATGGSTSGGGSTMAGASGAGAPGNSGGKSGGTGGKSSGGATSAGGKAGATSTGGKAGASNGGAANGGASNGGAGGAIVAPPGYKLVWSDEFNVDGPPDPKNWKFERGFVRNEEAQWYQPNNAQVQNGVLVIEARKERVMNPNYVAGSSDWKTNRQFAEYTSSSLNTSGLHSWQFGHFEMRARIPTPSGMWPAWWTLGVSGEWPSNGEIDIMEFYRGMILANVACGTTTRFTAKWDSATKQISSFNDASWASNFHVWSMDWDNTRINLMIDGQSLNTTDLASMLNPDGTSPFRQAAYMLLNLAIAGANGGDPSNTTFPQRYEIDYVRVFQPQ